MNYLNNSYLDEFFLKYNCEKDLAYYAYEKVIFEYLPKFIEHALKNYEPIIPIDIFFENLREGFSGAITDVYILDVNYKKVYLGLVNYKEFVNYFSQLSSEYNKESNINMLFIPKTTIIISAPTVELINFYYEELQREQYFTQMTR